MTGTAGTSGFAGDTTSRPGTLQIDLALRSRPQPVQGRTGGTEYSMDLTDAYCKNVEVVGYCDMDGRPEDGRNGHSPQFIRGGTLRTSGGEHGGIQGQHLRRPGHRRRENPREVGRWRVPGQKDGETPTQHAESERLITPKI